MGNTWFRSSIFYGIGYPLVAGLIFPSLPGTHPLFWFVAGTVTAGLFDWFWQTGEVNDRRRSSLLVHMGFALCATFALWVNQTRQPPIFVAPAIAVFGLAWLVGVAWDWFVQYKIQPAKAS